jgi:hypothetical protein
MYDTMLVGVDVDVGIFAPDLAGTSLLIGWREEEGRPCETKCWQGLDFKSTCSP